MGTYPKHLPQNLYKKAVILAVKALPMILVVAGVGLRCVKIYPVAQMVWTVGQVCPNHYPVHKWCGLLKTSIPCCLATSTPKPTTIRPLSSAQMVWTAERTVFLAVWPGLPQNQPLSAQYPVHKWCGLLKTSIPCYLAWSTPEPTTIPSLSSAQMVWTSENNYSLLFGQVHPKPINYVSQ